MKDSATHAALQGVPVTTALGATVTDADGAFAGLPVGDPVGAGASINITVNACGMGPVDCVGAYPATAVSLPLSVGVVAYATTIYLSALAFHNFTAATGLPPVQLTPNAVLSVDPTGDDNETAVFVRAAVVPPHAGPGALRSQYPGAVTGSNLLQSLFMVRVWGARGAGAARREPPSDGVHALRQ